MAVKSSQVFGKMDHPNDEDLSLGAQEEAGRMGTRVCGDSPLNSRFPLGMTDRKVRAKEAAGWPLGVTAVV